MQTEFGFFAGTGNLSLLVSPWGPNISPIYDGSIETGQWYYILGVFQNAEFVDPNDTD